MNKSTRSRARSQSTGATRWLVAALPAMALAAALMLPRLRSAHFGFFDDVNTLRVADTLVRGDWEPSGEAGSGRFRPLHWLYYAVIYRIDGANPTAFFAGNALMLMWIAGGVVALAYKFTGSQREAGLAGVLFVVSGPILENAYTLSKGELLQASWMVLSLLVIGQAQASANRPTRYLGIVVAALALFAASASKETSVVMVPIALAWLAVAILLRRCPGAAGGSVHLEAKLRFAVAAITGNLAYIVWRGSIMPIGLGQNTYASNYQLALSRIVESARAWLDWLNRDFLFLVPLLILVAWVTVRVRDLGRTTLIADGLVWMLGWLGLFLPWQHQLEYYLLPFAAGASIVGSTLVMLSIRTLRNERGWIRVASAGALLIAFIAFASTLPNNAGNGRLQLTIDQVNWQAEQYLAEHLPEASQLLINIQDPNQYVRDLRNILIELDGRADLQFGVYAGDAASDVPQVGRRVFVLSPIMENQFHPSVRLGFHEHTAKRWNASLLDDSALTVTPVSQFRGGFRSSSIDLLRLFCPLARALSYCDVPNTPFDLRMFSYGWDLFELTVPE